MRGFPNKFVEKNTPYPPPKLNKSCQIHMNMVRNRKRRQRERHTCSFLIDIARL